jgi:hypothetical protein
MLNFSVLARVLFNYFQYNKQFQLLSTQAHKYRVSEKKCSDFRYE